MKISHETHYRLVPSGRLSPRLLPPSFSLPALDNLSTDVDDNVLGRDERNYMCTYTFYVRKHAPYIARRLGLGLRTT